MDKILITGASGQLGKSLKNHLSSKFESYFFSRVELDISDSDYSKKLYADSYFDPNELSTKFHTILSELTVNQRNIFNMKYFDELKFKEISDITGVNINTIKSTYYLVEKKIKKELNE